MNISNLLKSSTYVCIVLFGFGSNAVWAQKLPVCHITKFHSGINLTFAHCSEERSGSVRGILRGGAGVDVTISSDNEMFIVEKVDSVDLSRQSSKESVTIYGDYLNHEINGKSASIELAQIPNWVIDFVNLHRANLESYSSLPGYRSIQRIYAEPERRARVQAAKDEEQRQRDQAAQVKREEALRAELAALGPVLAPMQVGQLFAKADELLEHKRVEGARMALRLLVAKYTGHPLATIAAQQLGNLSH